MFSPSLTTAIIKDAAFHDAMHLQYPEVEQETLNMVDGALVGLHWPLLTSVGRKTAQELPLPHPTHLRNQRLWLPSRP